MATSQVLIEHIEGTVAAPANTQSKQWAVNVDDGGGANDLSELVLKDGAGDEHTYITKSNTEIKISSAVSAAIAGLPDGVFVLAQNYATFKAYAEATPVYNIWVEGAEALSSLGSIKPISNKRIYGPSLTESFTIPSGEVVQFEFPAGTATNDIILDFYTGIDNQEFFYTSGGYSGNPYTYKVRSKQFSTNKVTSGAFAKIDYEINKDSSPINDFNVKNALWSGQAQIPQAAIYPWREEYQVKVDFGQSISITELDFESGINQNCYQNNSSIWIFKTNGFARRYEFSTLDAKAKLFQSDSSGVAGASITWVELEAKDAHGNKSYNGAAIPLDVNTTYKHTFHLGGAVDIHYTDGTRRTLVNAYLTNTAGDATYKTFDAGYAWLNTNTNTSLDRYVSGPHLANTIFTAWTHIYNETNFGDINIKTGASYLSTL